MINSGKLKKKNKIKKKPYSVKKNGRNERRNNKKREKKRYTEWPYMHVLMSKYNVIGHEYKNNNIYVSVNVYDSISTSNAPQRMGVHGTRVYVIK